MKIIEERPGTLPNFEVIGEYTGPTRPADSSYRGYMNILIREPIPTGSLISENDALTCKIVRRLTVMVSCIRYPSGAEEQVIKIPDLQPWLWEEEDFHYIRPPSAVRKRTVPRRHLAGEAQLKAVTAAVSAMEARFREFPYLGRPDER